jgi:hypothetical protein
MRCALLASTRISNPLFNRAEFDRARQESRKYLVPEQIEVGAGFQLEGEDAWIHCCPGDFNADPIAEPVDDECREKVREWMEEKRPLAIAQIRAQLDQIDLITDPRDKQHLLAMARSYGLISDKAKPPAKPSKPTEPASVA